MQRPDVHRLLGGMAEAARAAGRAILEVYRSDFEVRTKADATPVTEADLRAHEVLRGALRALLDVPLVSEEQVEVPHAVRASWPRYWLVDPLDGTREFVRRNDEFTVNVALVDGARPVAGVVHAPALGLTYAGAPGHGATRSEDDGPEQPIRTAAPTDRELVVLLSRSHAGPETHAFVERLRERFEVRTRTRGSALKACMVADGRAHLYPRFGPTSEWDTAASQAVLEAAGGVLCAAGGTEPLRYTKPSLGNPAFYAAYGPEAPHP